MTKKAYNTDYFTHYPGCWRDHRACAVKLAEKLIKYISDEADSAVGDRESWKREFPELGEKENVGE